MKKRLYMAMTFMVFLSLVGLVVMDAQVCTAQQKPSLTVVNPKVKMEKKTNIAIKGSGFAPGQEIRLVFWDANGVMTIINDLVKPELKVDQSGGFETSWDCGREIGKKLIKEGALVLTVTDSDYKTLAETQITFFKEKKKK